METRVSVVAVFVEIFLHCSTKELNKVELTVVFREHDAEMASSFNGLMHKGFLFLKMWLQIQNVLCTATVTVQLDES